MQKRDGEAVLFSWVEWPSKDVRDAGMKALEQDERMKRLVMPFDGQRMIYGGFSPVVEEGSADGTGYTDGIVAPVPLANRDAYIKMASGTARLFKEYGALRVVEGWGDDVPDPARSPISAARWQPKRARRLLSAGLSGLRSRCGTTPGQS
jgi:uncharacterized protein YbaA (DUF1428 family)